MPNENPSPQGQAAASAAVSPTLGMGASSSGLTYELNGVLLECANNPGAYPVQGDSEHPEWLWPTTLLEYRLEVQMDNGQSWWLNRPPTHLVDGRIQVSLRAKQGTRMAVFNVPADALETPIWYIGRPIPTPEPVEPPTPVDPADIPPPTIPASDAQMPGETPTVLSAGNPLRTKLKADRRGYFDVALDLLVEEKRVAVRDVQGRGPTTQRGSLRN